MEHQLVIFTVAGENYGVEIGSVESIVKMQAITSIPHSLPFVEGITNLRGVVLPVINLRSRFGMPPHEADKNTRIVIALNETYKVGMIVDSVSEVLRIQDHEIEPPPPMVTTVDSSYITGIAKVDGRLIILLNLSRILNVDEQMQIQHLAV
jgi:purine-binding chemotaxis protein CheW